MKNKLKYNLRFFVAASACAFLLLSYQSCTYATQIKKLIHTDHLITR